MREIKLRVWDKTRNQMFEVVAYYPTLKSVDVIYKYRDGVSNKFNLYGNAFELMQFTGLKDKNGKEIYEGDILEETMFVGWCESQGGFQLFLKNFNDDKTDYCMACGGDIHWMEIAEDMTYEVIGNIFESPELLK